MKTSISIIFITLFLLSSVGKSYAQCDGTNDIIQDDFDNELPSFLLPAGNTFTATCSGNIEGVSFWTRRVTGGSIGGVSVTLELWSQPLSSSTRTLINSQTLDLPFSGSQQEHYFQFDNVSPVNSGELYAFRVVKNDDDRSIDLRTHEATDVYSGGEIFTGQFWNFDPISEDWDIRFQVHYFDEVAPNANCKNITRSLGTGNTVSISASNINNNSNDDDTGIASFGISQNTFNCTNIGDNTVTLFVTDQNGNSSSCQAIVTILDENAPVLTCPGDITFGTDPGVPATVTYNDILYSDCTVEAPSGFTLLGIRDERTYFISNNAILVQNAHTDAESKGGFVATIWDDAHNAYIRNAVNTVTGNSSEQVLIGYSDAPTEGFFRWHGENSGYENWGDGEPNNLGDEDYTVIRTDGKWNDINRNQSRKYILELSNPTITQTAGLPSGSVFPLGDTVNTFQATDASGNVGTCSFTVTVVQNPYETNVEIDNGALKITDIETDSDDQITLSSDGTTLTISNLATPVQVSGGPTLTDPTTVTVPLASITNGIEFNANNGDDTVNFNSDLTLTGANNGISLYGLSGLSAYSQSGAIDIEGAFIIDNSSSAFILIGELTAASLSITNVDRIRDRIVPLPITIAGQTDLQATTNISIIEGATHTFNGVVNLESRDVSFYAIGPTTLGTVTATGTDDFSESYIRVGPGSLELTGDITTAGNSDLRLRAQTTITQTSGTITTDLLTLEGRNDGGTTAILLGDNDVNILETLTGDSLELIVLNDIDDVELGLIIVDGITVIAPTIILSEDTELTKNNSGVASLLGNIDLTATSGTNSAVINHNGGLLEFAGDTIDLSGNLDYNGVLDTTTRFLGNTTLDPDGISPFFGNLYVEGIFALEVFVNVLNEAKFSKETTVLKGRGSLGGGPTIIENDAVVTPGIIGDVASLSFNNLLISSGTYAPAVENDDDYDILEVAGTVTLTNAALNPIGGFTAQSDDVEIMLIDNDGTDAVVGTFNGIPEGGGVTFGSYTGILSYAGGDGNDITLLPDTVDPVAVCQDLSLAIGLDGVVVTPDMIDNGSTDNVAIASLLIDGASQKDFTYEDLGDNEVTLTVVDTSGNTAQCTATVNLTSTVTFPIQISEYQPQTTNDPQSIEIKGEAGEAFLGTFVVIEGDTDTSDIGVVKSADSFSGTFNADGLLVATVPNIVGPTHTVILTTSFSGTVNITDIDSDDDGTADDLTAFGIILDAVGVGDGGACCPLDVLYGTDFGGVNLTSIGGIPSAIFRLGSTGNFYQIASSNDNIYDNTGTLVDAFLFDIVPTANGTFGTINPLVNASTDAFVTTWKTDNSGSSGDDQITIFTDNSLTYDYRVDWGDGTVETGITGNITHTYDSAGTYTIRIIGTFPRFISNGSFFGDAEKLLSIDQWGTNAWTSFAEAFYECENMDMVATDIPDLSNVTSLFSMFGNCNALVGNASINNWDVSTVENMQLLFVAAINFNQPLDNWNVSNVTNMASMFNTAESFNQNLNSWNTSQVQFMDFLFLGALNFNGAIGNWNVSNVVEMSWMFNNAEDFNQDLNSWNVSQVQEMDFMFLGATNFNGNISNWNPAQVTTMYAMFQNAANFNQDISGWDVGLVTDMGWMFRDATNFNQNLGSWDVSNVGQANEMFIGTALSNVNYDSLLLGWSQLTLQNNISFGTDASYCLGAEARDILTDPSGLNWTITDGGLNCDSVFITSWKTDNLGFSTDNQIKITTAFGETYDYNINWGDGTSDTGVTGDITHTYGAPGTYTVTISGTFPRITTDTPGTPGDTSDRLKLIEVVQWGTNPWTSMRLAFDGCANLDVTATDTPNLSSATSLSNMFARCQNLQGTAAFNNWDVSTITNMRALFFNTNNFNQELSNWNVSMVESMDFMFMFTNSFNQDISNWDVSAVTTMENMFNSATAFDQDLGNWDISSLQDAEDMFNNATLSTVNYDNTLIGWATLDAGETQIPVNITFDGGNSQYCLGEVSRNTLTDPSGLNWTITDGGLDCTSCTATTTYTTTGWDNGAPDSSTLAIIAFDYDTSANGDIDACELKISSGATLTVGADDYVKVENDIEVEGSLFVSHTGNLVQTADDAQVINDGAININVTTPVLQTRDFMIMGSPMTTESRTDVYDSAFLVSDHTPENFIPHPDVAPGGTNFADDNGDFWTQMASGIIDPGRGYIVRPQDSYTDPANEAYNFTYALGTLNNGIVTKPAVYNGASNPDGTPNVYANPYASAISADDFINANPLVSELYFWEHLTPPSTTFPGSNSINFSMDDISMYNLSGGVAAANDPTGTETEPNGIIATSQGFGVKAFASGNVTFNNTMRLTSGNTTLRFAEQVDKIWLQVTNLDYELGSNTLIAFNPVATEDMDSGYDSNRLATAISLYSHLKDGNGQLGIQTLDAFTSNKIIPIGFSTLVKEESYYNVSISNLEGDQISEVTVYLTDNYLNITTNLSEGDYYFSSEEGDFKGRFTLSFEEPIILSSNDNALQKISIVPNPTHGLLNIQSPTSIQQVQVYDMQGRIVVDLAGNGLEFLEVNIEDMASAMYFLKVYTEKGSVTKRIIKE